MVFRNHFSNRTTEIFDDTHWLTENKDGMHLNLGQQSSFMALAIVMGDRSSKEPLWIALRIARRFCMLNVDAHLIIAVHSHTPSERKRA